ASAIRRGTPTRRSTSGTTRSRSIPTASVAGIDRAAPETRPASSRAGRTPATTCRSAAGLDIVRGDRAHGFDRIRVVCALVEAIALHAREAQRDTAGVLRARLHAVEC